jgi:putative ABC transport system permease protein
MVIAQLCDANQSDSAMRKITALLRQRHHIASSALDDFTITNPGATMTQVNQMGSTLSATLEGTAILATLIGGVVIMSLMLIAVSERRKEIGVRRSVGASRRDIVVQFIAEALLVSSLGGLIGIVLGAAGTGVLAKIQNVSPIFAWRTLVWASAGSVGLGLVFGIYPAWKAARVDPVKALRS